MSRVKQLTIAIVFFIAPLAVFAQSVDQLRSQITSHQSQIETLNAEIAKYEKELQVVGAKKQTLQTAVDTLNLSVKRTQTKIKAIQQQIASTELEIQNLSNNILDKESAIALGERAIAERIRDIHESDTAGFVETLFSHESFSGVWDDVDASMAMQEDVRRQITTLEQVKVELIDTKTAEEEKRAELLDQRTDLSNEERSLTVQKKEQQDLLSQTKSQESNYQAILKQKQAEKKSFESALFELASQLEYVLDPSKVPPIGKGVLRWPLDNVFVTQQFGRTSDSGRLYTSGTHDGVDFRASIGTPVKAALSGTVMEVNHGAARNCQYGKWVLVKHPNGLATLYAHLSDIAVSKGETVTTGKAIGYAGDTGYATGPHLHFTVYMADAVSFKQYTCKSGAMVNVPIAPVNGYLDPLGYL